MALAPPMVMVDVSARATISIISWDDSTATAGAMRKSDGLSRLSVPSHVAVATEGQAIRHVVAELGMIPVGENVMCSQALLTLAASASAVAAGKVVTRKHCVAPSLIGRILEALPGPTTLPLRMILSSQERAPFDLGAQCLLHRLR